MLANATQNAFTKSNLLRNHSVIVQLNKRSFGTNEKYISKSSLSFWKDINNQKKFIEYASERLDIKTMSDWYKVSSKVSILFARPQLLGSCTFRRPNFYYTSKFTFKSFSQL
jgi:hypothetical protein